MMTGLKITILSWPACHTEVVHLKFKAE
jgi:hypothetical protein